VMPQHLAGSPHGFIASLGRPTSSVPTASSVWHRRARGRSAAWSGAPEEGSVASAPRSLSNGRSVNAHTRSRRLCVGAAPLEHGAIEAFLQIAACRSSDFCGFGAAQFRPSECRGAHDGVCCWIAEPAYEMERYRSRLGPPERCPGLFAFFDRPRDCLHVSPQRERIECSRACRPQGLANACRATANASTSGLLSARYLSRRLSDPVCGPSARGLPTSAHQTCLAQRDAQTGGEGLRTASGASCQIHSGSAGGFARD
jgi:hypothetical protein